MDDASYKPQSMTGRVHQSVMVDEVIRYLITDPMGIYLDCTFGEGGHSLHILQHLNPDRGKVIGIDKDVEILRYGEQRINAYTSQTRLFKANYTDMDLVLKGLGISKVHGILFDLGVSSYQLDVEDRGFSYRNKGPLDMRMDTQTSKSAAQILNQLPQKEIEEILRTFGEEPFARSISRKIVEMRPLHSTLDLVQCVQNAIPLRVRKKMKKHFATRTFQAIRIFLNRELEELSDGLEKSLKILDKGGRIVVISFHSLEDRIVKHFFRDNEGQALKILTPKPIQPDENEKKRNRRSRSAKLRAAETLSD
jgi:16S rRNA (cytosine1402-N4)-methyltransferase